MQKQSICNSNVNGADSVFFKHIFINYLCLIVFFWYIFINYLLDGAFFKYIFIDYLFKSRKYTIKTFQVNLLKVSGKKMWKVSVINFLTVMTRTGLLNRVNSDKWKTACLIRFLNKQKPGLPTGSQFNRLNRPS